MKNLSLVLNVVLLVAVIILYVLHFSGPKSEARFSPADTTISNSPIAYILTDSVLDNYDYLKARQDVLKQKSKSLEQEYRTRAQGLQNEINAYQRNRNNLTFGQDQAMQEDLGKKQQNLQMYEQTLSQQLMNEQQKLMKELYDRLTTYCKEYAEKNGLHVILKYDQTSDVLYGAGGIDITRQVINGLNEAYKNEKSAPVKSDSTARAR
jgi:outer membrane protein